MRPPNYVSLLWVTPLGRVFKSHDFFALVSQRHSANGLRGNFCVRSNEDKTAESCRLMLDSGRRHKSNSLPRYLFTP